MSWENTVIGEVCSVATQETDTTVLIGGQSLSGTETAIPNPLSGHRMWDRLAYFFSLGNIMGGSFTVEVQGTVAGVAGLPFARKVVDNTICNASPNGTSTIALESCNNSPYGLNPVQVLWDETAAGGITGSVIAYAKSRRGQISSGTLNPQRVQEGTIANIPVAGAGSITADITVPLSHTGVVGSTASFPYGGLAQNALWDSALYWMNVTGASGTWNVYALGKVNGNTVIIAGASGIGAGTTATGATKVAFKSSTFGANIKPTAFKFDVTTAGAAQNISGVIVYAAKTTKGQRRGR